MDEIEVLEARVKAFGDQTAAHVRGNLTTIKRIASAEPSEWTADDLRIIRGTLSAVIGWVYEGRI